MVCLTFSERASVLGSSADRFAGREAISDGGWRFRDGRLNTRTLYLFRPVQPDVMRLRGLGALAAVRRLQGAAATGRRL